MNTPWEKAERLIFLAGLALLAAHLMWGFL
jgi:hypothetical protein